VIASLLGLRGPFAVAAVAFAAMLATTWRITANRSIEEARAS
jgi:hypothetical protein